MPVLLIASDIIVAGITFFRFQTIPPQIPLFYSRQGEDQITEWWMIFLLPFLLHVLVLLNKFVANRFFKDNAFVKQLVMYTNNILILVFTAIYIKIIFLIT